ncbi:DUF2812 domain-containing protein [uncultured Clostridium sp.]|uniref:DUF2812 domain-containing protein n=1 Tax=uncultured Clostridium sp. TaxID=59620 RepID=UPI00258E8D25|nr:DUF2812 domain-containing protein [uncultured Clostridium sp.]
MIFRKKKWVSFSFLPYEYKCLEDYLEKMAEKGWILEDISGSSLKFVRSSSKSLNYLVYIINNTSIFGGKDIDKASEYKKYCKEVGWTLVCESDKMQIYCSELYNMKVDINENEREKFNTISKASVKYIFLKLITVIFLLLSQYIGTIGSSNRYFLANSLSLGSLIFVTILFIHEILSLITLLIFFIKGKVLINNGIKVDYNFKWMFSLKKLIYNFMIISMAITFLYFGIDFYYNKKISIDEVTLKLQDFNDVDKDDSEWFRVDKSPIANYIFYSNEGNKMYLSYELLESKYKWAVKYNFNKRINYFKELGISYKEKETNLAKDIKVYVNEERFKYIIVSENKMIEIYEADTVSEEKLINIVYEKVFKK